MKIALLFELPRYAKRIIMMLSDILFIASAFFLTQKLTSHSPILSFSIQHQWLMLSIILVSIPLFSILGLYHAIVRFMGEKALFAVAQSTGLSTIAYAVFSLIAHEPFSISHAIIFWFLLLTSVGGARFIVRHAIHAEHSKRKQNIIIYGAGSTGTQLLKSLQNSQEYQAAAFVDDRAALQKGVIDGIKVYAPEALPMLLEKYNIQQILLAMPSVSRLRKQNIITTLETFSIHVKTIPNLTDIMTGKAAIEEIRDIDIEDLLGRDSIEPNMELMNSCITGKIVLVTGAGGSIGAELCRQIFKQSPRELLLLDSSEYALYIIEKELLHLPSAEKPKITSLLASVQDKSRLRAIFSAFKIDTIYHAAAYKHVPMVEHNIVEGIKNNIFGTLYTAELAREYNVKTFVLVSTDKAVRPTNIMGTTKRIAELILQAFAHSNSKTTFCIVRFGNVLGSSGSVVPLFREQILAGGPVTVTHPEVIRYFMTSQEAAQLVIQAGSMATGGDVFVLDMGEPVKISDLAKKMIRLMGLEVKDEAHPEGEIEIKYPGLRPGEKLFEELLIGDNPIGTSHSRIMRAEENKLAWDELNILLGELSTACATHDCGKIQHLLINNPTGYTPVTGISDHIWQITLRKNANRSNVFSVLKNTHSNSL